MKAEDRFTSRVEDYIRYRPHYPPEVYDALLEKNVITPASVVADIGCGTGISSELFLSRGHTVYGVEPNEAMLAAATRYLKDYPDFKPVRGSAENTTLEPGSIDLLVCAQAFHWFNKTDTKKEFKRVLRESGQIALMWNDRKTTGSDFQKVYEDFLQMFGTDYKIVDHKKAQEESVLRELFHNGYSTLEFPNQQELDLEGLKGRVLSSSYMPENGHVDFDFMMYCLKKIFSRFEVNGKIAIEYQTKIYYGTL